MLSSFCSKSFWNSSSGRIGSQAPIARCFHPLLKPSKAVSTRSSARKPSFLTHSLRTYAHRSTKYIPKYESQADKRSILPSNILDPRKERKMAPLRRKDLAFDESELGEAIFEAFDVNLDSRELSSSDLSDLALEELAIKQAEREESNLLLKETRESTGDNSNTTTKSARNKNIKKSTTRTPNANKTKELSPSAQPAQVSFNSANTPLESEINRKPLVAIVGRPNVGKSTLFNRLIRKSKSLITTTAGTTRDRKYGFTEWENYDMMMVDTGGMLGEGDEWAESITEQAKLAIEEADLIIMVGDVVDGITENDRVLARMLRKTLKPVILAVNKCDNEERLESQNLVTFIQLGLGEPYPISASHGSGTPELMDSFIAPLKKLGFRETPRSDEVPSFAVSTDKLVTSGAFHSDGTRKEIKVALVGVPNAGKSSLLNQILGKPRTVVSARPGTTTDPIDEKILWKGSYPITIVDTAGVRKKKSQEGHVEKLSALWSLKVIESSHVAVLMIDATAGAQHQDVRLSSYIIDNYRSCIVVINKWDLAPDRSIIGMQAYEEQLRERLQFWYYVPVVFASAKTGFNVDSIMAWIVRVSDERRIHLATRKLFQILEQASMIKPPPASGRRRLKFRFCTQVNLGGSPTFVFFVNFPELADGPYTRFLEGIIRQNYAFTGTPLRLMFRKNAGRTLAERERGRRLAKLATSTDSMPKPDKKKSVHKK